VRILLFGARGKVGMVLGPRLAEAGHVVTDVERGESPRYEDQDVAVDFTRPDTVRANVEGCLGADLACIVGTSGLAEDDLASLDGVAKKHGVVCFVAPNFALGAVLMMRFAAEAAGHLPKAEIIELHHEAKLDAPSGTAKATAALLPGDVPIHSVRLPGLLAHQEVIFGGLGQTLTIRHDTLSREAFVPGVLLALSRLPTLPPGVTVGLEALLD
jgi:4-hydroxy-tetrahydrodipicolinate reductase